MSDFASVSHAVGAAAAAGASALGLFEQIFANLESLRERRLSAENCLRAYYIEVVNNLEILSVLNLAALRRERVNSPRLGFVLGQLHTEIGAAVLFQDQYDEQSSLYRFLREQGRVRNRNKMLVKTENGRDVPVAGASFYENILQAVGFTVVKTGILRRLNAFSDAELELVRDIRVEKRLVNLAERFQMIKEKLDDFPGIRELAR